MRMHDVPETAISGAVTGGIINAWRRTYLLLFFLASPSSILARGSGGSAGILAGARTAAIICTVLQFAFNELGVARVKFVSRKIQESQPRPEIAPPPAAPEKPRMSIFDRLMTVIEIGRAHV